MSSKAKAIIFVIFVSAFVYFCWYAYFVQIDKVNESEIPVLKAQANIKSKPDNPGGMEVLNKDKDIYKHMLGNKKIDNNIKVVEDSEKPVSRESLEELINKQLKNGGSNNKNHRGAVIIETKKIDAVQKTLETKSKSDSNKPLVSKHNYSIRVAKLKDKKFIFRGIEIFQQKYPSLKRYRGELFEKNGEYFLHFSNITSQKEAAKICDILSEEGVRCSIHGH